MPDGSLETGMPAEAKDLAMTSIIIIIIIIRSLAKFAVQTHTPIVNADKMSISRRSPSLILGSMGVDGPCCRKPHESLRSFSMTGTIFWSILSHFARIQSSRWQYFTSTNHLSSHVVFISTFTEGLLQKPPSIHQTSRCLVHGRDVTRRG